MSIFFYVLSSEVGRDSSVGTANRYGLDGLGIESRCWQDFYSPVQTGPGPTHRITPGRKLKEAYRSPPTPLSTEVKEREKLYLYYPSGLSGHVIE